MCPYYPKLCGRLIRRIQGNLCKKQNLISKITRAKRIGGMAHVAEHLPSKSETLNSSPSTTKKKKKKKKRR
jgi:hypothetical protein